LLNDFVDLSAGAKFQLDQPFRIPYRLQARVLDIASQPFLSLINASPFKPPKQYLAARQAKDVTLFEFVDLVASFFQEVIYGREFLLDPVGSFTVPENSDDLTVAIIEQLLELGGL